MKKIYLDVRTPEEFAAERFPNAINHSLQLIMDGKMPDIPKDAEILVHCRTGARSAVAVELMKEAGFSNVVNIGGLNDVVGELERRPL